MYESAFEPAPNPLTNNDAVTFSQSAQLPPSQDPQNKASENELAAPFHEAIQAIAALERTVQQKDLALLQNTIAAAELTQRLDDEKKQNHQLAKKLTASVTAHELLTAKTSTEGRDTTTRGRLIPESEVTLMKEQWRASQKLLERELARLRSEVVRTTSEKQQLDIQIRAQRAEAARASLQVAKMERQADFVRETAGVAVAASADHRRWKVLSATSAAMAMLLLAAGMAWHFSGSLHWLAGRPETGPQPVVSESRSSPTPSLSASTLATGSFGGPAPFRALSRLNNSLSIPGGATPEQLLRAVHEHNAKTDPGVCNFAWNNGQPALNYGGRKLSMEASLDQCATAVDKFLRRE